MRALLLSSVSRPRAGGPAKLGAPSGADGRTAYALVGRALGSPRGFSAFFLPPTHSPFSPFPSPPASPLPPSSTPLFSVSLPLPTSSSVSSTFALPALSFSFFFSPLSTPSLLPFLSSSPRFPSSPPSPSPSLVPPPSSHPLHSPFPTPSSLSSSPKSLSPLVLSSLWSHSPSVSRSAGLGLRLVLASVM